MPGAATTAMPARIAEERQEPLGRRSRSERLRPNATPASIFQQPARASARALELAGDQAQVGKQQTIQMSLA